MIIRNVTCKRWPVRSVSSPAVQPLRNRVISSAAVYAEVIVVVGSSIVASLRLELCRLALVLEDGGLG